MLGEAAAGPLLRIVLSWGSRLVRHHLGEMDDPFREPVSLSAPDPLWPRQYSEAATEIAERMRDLSPTIEHIGSTAVPLRGKPILDIQVAVEECNLEAAIAALSQLGYRHHGQGGVPGREYLTRRGDGLPPVNVHLFAEGNPVLEDNRLICEYLRANPDVAREYVSVKERALDQGHADLLTYSQAKGSTVAALRDSARRAKGQPPPGHRSSRQAGHHRLCREGD